MESRHTIHTKKVGELPSDEVGSELSWKVEFESRY